MAEFVFNCPSCEGSISANDSLCGQPETCPHCGNEICIPIPGLQQGAIFGDFELLEHLGTGASGEVWTARQLDMDRIVALKILLPSLATNSNFIDRFKKEVKHSAKLTHPNIVTAYHSGSDKGIYYLAITYVNGKTIAEKIKNKKIFSEFEALEIIKCIAQALDYAWKEYRIIHRDIKPENIMIDIKGKPMLLDLGIAKSTQEESGLTMTGTVIGTPYYMSPEQAIGDKNIDFKSDIYSLGATFYHMITGTVPYNADSAMAIMMKHLNEEFVAPTIHNSSISKNVEAIIKKMMAKDKNSRYQSWSELIEDLDKILKKKKPIHASGKKSSISLIFLFLIIPTALICTGFYLFLSTQNEKKTIKTDSKTKQTEQHVSVSKISQNEKLPPKPKKSNKQNKPNKPKKSNKQKKQKKQSSAKKSVPVISKIKKESKKLKKTRKISSKKPIKSPSKPPVRIAKKKTKNKPKEATPKADKKSVNKETISHTKKKKEQIGTAKPMINIISDTPEVKIKVTEEDKELMKGKNTFPYTSEKLDLKKHSSQDVDEYWREINGTKVTWQGNVTMDRSLDMNRYEVRVYNRLAKKYSDFNIVLNITDKKEIKKFTSSAATSLIFTGIIYKKVHSSVNGAVTVYLKKVKFQSLF